MIVAQLVSANNASKLAETIKIIINKVIFVNNDYFQIAIMYKKLVYRINKMRNFEILQQVIKSLKHTLASYAIISGETY